MISCPFISLDTKKNIMRESKYATFSDIVGEIFTSDIIF